MFMAFADIRPKSSIQHREKRESRFEVKLISFRNDPFTPEINGESYRRTSLGERRATARHRILIDRTE
jgi:hypothetical protein